MKYEELQTMLHLVARMSSRVESMKLRLADIHIKKMEEISSGFGPLEATDSQFMDLLMEAETQIDIIDESIFPLWTHLNSMNALAKGNAGVLQ